MREVAYDGLSVRKIYKNAQYTLSVFIINENVYNDAEDRMSIKKFLKRLGPGFITGAADDDPSGIATYSQTGVQFGYGQLWTALFSFPFMVAVQEMCGRIGLVTGSGLSTIMRKHYPRPVLSVCVLLLVLANTINIGADLGAMASAAQMLFHVPFVFWLFALTLFTLGLELFVPYPTYAKFLKYLTLSLFAYVGVAFLVKQDWHLVLTSTFFPSFSFDRPFLLNIMAVLGTTISPYLFFWQTDEEVEEAIAKGRSHSNRNDVKAMRVDTMLGMFFSNLVMFFIIMTAASVLRAQGITHIDTAAQAAEALRPLAGDFTFFLFALGILGTGLLAVPILAGSASYAVTEALGWKSGLSRTFKQAHGFYGIIAVATLLGLLVNFFHVPSFQMLYYTAVFNGLSAPPLLLLILLISNNKQVMGEQVNGRLSNILGVIIIAVMTGAGLAVLFF